MASCISDAPDAETQGTTAVLHGISWTTNDRSRHSSMSAVVSSSNTIHEEIPDGLVGETISESDSATSLNSSIGSILVAHSSDALSAEVKEDFSVRGRRTKKNTCRDVGYTISSQAQTYTAPIMSGDRRNAKESRQLTRSIQQMERISGSRNNHSEETQDVSEYENDQSIIILDNNITEQLNSNMAIAPASLSLSAPRRRIRVSGDTGSTGGNSSSVESEIGSGRSITRPRHGGSHAERSSLPVLQGNEEDNVGDENTLRRRRTFVSGNSLALSLDAGMSSLRRWIRNRRFGLGGGGNDAGSSSGQSSSSMTTMRLDEEDIFAISNMGSDLRRFSTTASSNSSDPAANYNESDSRNGFLYYRPFEVRTQNYIHTDSAIYGSDDGSGNRSRLLYPLESSIESEVEDRRQQLRQRSNSEPDRARLVDFLSIFYGSRAIDHSSVSGGAVISERNRGGRAQLQSPQWSSMRHVATTSPIITEEVDDNNEEINPMVRQEFEHPSNMHPFTSVSDDLFATTPSSSPSSGNATEGTRGGELVHEVSPNNENTFNLGSYGPDRSTPNPSDPDQEARIRWIRINRRFKGILESVAVLFSLLLCCILISWVLMTSAYVLSRNKSCDVPLRAYFWLVSIQLMLDIFRTDIMKRLCRWQPESHEQVPLRVILYNIGYLIYAMIVLRIGVTSVFTGSSCSGTAPELFYASLVFVSLSLVAWALIILGYLIPMIFVAVLLSRNNYFPNGATRGRRGRIGGFAGEVFPNTNTNPAPPGCIEKLRVILLAEFPDSYQRECCICMMEYKDGEVIVTTPCEHVFHKRCCQEWFQLARTCPVCRADVPGALGNHDSLRIFDSEDRLEENLQDISQNPEGIGAIELPMGG